jgi:hypothetical protein
MNIEPFYTFKFKRSLISKKVKNEKTKKIKKNLG